MKNKKIACVVGTRPEAIKMAPVILALRNEAEFDVTVLATGQHTDMLYQALATFDIAPDVRLDIMRDRQTLDYITSAVLQGVGAFLDANPQDLILVHGDTSTTLSAALAGFYRHTLVGHVEAGLRSHNMALPFPEEANRVLTDRIADLFFAPTEDDAENLKREGIDPSRVYVTGNTVIDALFWTLEHVKPGREVLDILESLAQDTPFILMTAHRRESWGEPLARICDAVLDLLKARPDIRVLIPLHKNPTVRDLIRSKLAEPAKISQVIFTEPLCYPDMVAAMNRSAFILTDSGGIQEEATALRKPVLIMRTLSERPQAVTLGTGVLVGTDREKIVDTALKLLNNPDYKAKFENRGMPFGNGCAALQIRDIIRDTMGGLGVFSPCIIKNHE